MKLHTLGGSPDARDVVLLLHGFGADRLSWTGTASALAEHALVLAADLPGHGTAAGEGAESFEALVDGARGALEADERWNAAARRHLVGHSLGGALAASLADPPAGAARDELSIASLSLIAPLGLGERIDVDWLRAFVSLDDPDAANAHLARLVVDPRFVPPQLGTALVEHLRRDGVRERLRGLVAAIENGAAALGDTYARLADGTLSRTVIRGEEDVIVEASDAALERFGGERLVLDRCGHLPHIERRTIVNRTLVAATS